MTTSTPASTAEPSAPPRSLRPTRRLAVGAVVSVAIASALTWWSHPDALDGYVGGYVAGPRPLSEGSMNVGLGAARPGREGSITVDDPLVTEAEGSVAVRTDLWVCERDDDTTFIGFGGVDQNTLTEYCVVTRTVDGPQRLRLDDSEYLVLQITPTEPGRWALDRVTIDVQRGAAHLFQRGRETIELSVSGTTR